MNLDYLTRGLKINPYQHQLDAVEFFQDKKDGCLFFEMGCVSGDTEVFINRNGASRRMTIAEAFLKVPTMRDIYGKKAIVKTRSCIGDRIGLNEIQSIIYSGVKTVYRLTLSSGKTLKLTTDHEVLTSDGYIKTEFLTINNLVMVDNNIKPKKLGKKIPINYHYTIVNDHPYGRKRGKYRVVATHRLIAEKELNGGNYLDPEIFAVHHIDLNYKNNSVSNLLICTHAEHHKIHKDLSVKNLSQGIIEYDQVSSIELVGEEKTYDMVCSDPHRNFVANGIVIHNCGKTGTAILNYRNWCRKEGRLLRCLIVAPSVVLHNWKDEFKLFSLIDQDKIIALTRGTGKTKADTIYDNVIPVIDGMIVNVNYEALLSEDLFRAIETWNPEVIIFDEVHYVKNATAKRSKLCTRLAEKALYRLGLTGTPILRNSLDMYGIFRTVDIGKTFGTNLYIFQNKYLIDRNARNPNIKFPSWVDNPVNYKELNEKIYAKSLRKLKSECLDLPDLIKIIRHVEWGKKQKKAYDDLKKDFLAFVEARSLSGEPASVTANLAITKALRMLQVASGFVMTDDGVVHEFDEIPRLDLVEELLTEIVIEGGNKCILWCSYKHNYKMLQKICEKLKINYCFITGEQNTTEKRKSELAFQNDPNMKVIIANRGAGGVGINLTAASYSIVYSRNFSLAEELQSEARNHRGGSERHEKIIKIDLVIKDSIEESQIKALASKNQISTDILDMVK